MEAVTRAYATSPYHCFRATTADRFLIGIPRDRIGRGSRNHCARAAIARGAAAGEMMSVLAYTLSPRVLPPAIPHNGHRLPAGRLRRASIERGAAHEGARSHPRSVEFPLLVRGLPCAIQNDEFESTRERAVRRLTSESR